MPWNAFWRLTQRWLTPLHCIYPALSPLKLPTDRFLRLQRGDVSAKAGAGVYFEERRAMLMTLHRLLQVRAMPGHVFKLGITLCSKSNLTLKYAGPRGCYRSCEQVQALGLSDTSDEIYNVICACNQQLLAQEAQGSCRLVARIIGLIQDTSLEPKGQSRITSVVDLQGQQLERHLLLQRERTLLCEVRPTPGGCSSIEPTYCIEMLTPLDLVP